MKQAIISGSTGLIGKNLAKFLNQKKINTVCLGRRKLDRKSISNLFGFDANYVSCRMDKINDLTNILTSLGWNFGSGGTFYNFAWRGESGLTDGTLEQQLINVSFGVNAIKTANKIGCDKFVSSGSLEETLTESFLQGKLPNYKSTQSNYAIAKLASRDMNLICSYLDKISYIHTRISLPLDPFFQQGGYVSNVLSKIYEKKPYDSPINNQLFDIILLDDVAKAYFQIGSKGLNKADYFIGTGSPTTLENYFSDYKNLLYGENKIEDFLHKDDSNFFNTQILKKDTGFTASKNRFQIKGLI